MTFDAVRKIGLALPDVEEGTAYGSPALKVKGTLLACMAIHRSAEPNTLAVRVPEEDRDDLIGAAPATYYLTDHYRDYSTVLVRLARIRAEELRDLLKMSHAFIGRTARAKSQPRRLPSIRK